LTIEKTDPAALILDDKRWSVSIQSNEDGIHRNNNLNIAILLM
jgi:hypothetical protein